MSSELDHYEKLIDELVKRADDRDRMEIDEDAAVAILGEIVGAPSNTREEWEVLSSQLRRRIVRNNYTVQWDFFRRIVRLSKLPSVEELESVCELYQDYTPREIERRIRGLGGFEFETFLGSILGRLPHFREITTTRLSRDEGIDLKGLYIPSDTGPQFVLRGQAKQTQDPVTASQARDFIGALNIANERGMVGLFVSTSGFTAPARDALEKSSVRIMQWDMEMLVTYSKELTTRRIELSFGVPDHTFWDEVLGRT